MYELCNLQLAYKGTARLTVPDVKPAARLEYGSRIIPMLANLMDLEPSARMSTRSLVRALEEYCASRLEKQKAQTLWQDLTVMAPAEGTASKSKKTIGANGDRRWEDYSPGTPQRWTVR